MAVEWYVLRNRRPLSEPRDHTAAVADEPRPLTTTARRPPRGRRQGVRPRRPAGHEALEGIDLDIARGEFVSLIGPSGCGKSTLLRIVGDLTGPTAGKVAVNGKPAERARRDRDYGMVFQAPVLFDWRTVEDNVKLPLEVMGATAERDRRGRARCSSSSSWATS